jgi:hypothetical protein
MSNQYDPLDRALNLLPRDVSPGRDLWSDIAAQIGHEAVLPARRRGLASVWAQAAAAVLLVAVSSMTTYLATRPKPGTDAVTAAVVPAALGIDQLGIDQLGPKYVSARADLERTFNQRIASLPPAARAKVQSNLADIRRAANEVAKTLAQHPSDPLLQELLVSTYQSEVQLFADVSAMVNPVDRRT